MRKLLLILFLTPLFFSKSFAQDVKITAIIEGDCPTSGDTAVRAVQLYVNGTVDVSDLKLQFQFPFNANWVTNGNIGTGSYTDTFLYFVNDADAFDREFPGIRTPNNTSVGVFVYAGGGKIRLVDKSNSDAVIDIYGIDGVNGENESWNFENSYVKRKAGFGPNPTFTESEWDIQPKNTIVSIGACWGDPAINTIVNLQTGTLSNDTFTLGKNSLNIAPNPAKETINFVGIEQAVKYAIYDLTGKNVANGTVNNKESINISALNKGIYLIKANNTVLKFIKN